jgi:hypothetical protein
VSAEARWESTGHGAVREGGGARGSRRSTARQAPRPGVPFRGQAGQTHTGCGPASVRAVPYRDGPDSHNSSIRPEANVRFCTPGVGNRTIGSTMALRRAILPGRFPSRHCARWVEANRTGAACSTSHAARSTLLAPRSSLLALAPRSSLHASRSTLRAPRFALHAPRRRSLFARRAPAPLAPRFSLPARRIGAAQRPPLNASTIFPWIPPKEPLDMMSTTSPGWSSGVRVWTISSGSGMWWASMPSP